MNVFKRLFEAFPVVPFVIMLTLSTATGIGLGKTALRLSRYPSQPIPATATQALEMKEPRWIRLDGVSWRCDESLPVPGETLYVLRDDAEGFLVTYYDGHKPASCEALSNAPATGLLEPLPARAYERYKALGWKALDGTPPEKILRLCGPCGPNDDRLGVKVMGATLALFLTLTVFYGRRWRTAARSAA